MDSISIGAISAWQQQQVAQQVGIAMLKKSLDMEAEGALALVQMVTDATSTNTPVAVTSPDATVGQNLDVVA
jgi:hypothetical protein